MKQFRVTEIITTADGRVVLNGPSGSIDVRRWSLGHSSATFHRFQYSPLDIQEQGGDHAETIENVPQPIGSIPGSCAF